MCFFLLKCWICWIMLDLRFQKHTSFCWNVEYVEYVECFLPRGPHLFFKGGGPVLFCMLNSFCRKNCFSFYDELFLKKAAWISACWIISAERREFFSKHASFCWNVEYVESCSIQCYKKNASFCWNVEYVEYVECFLPHGPHLFFKRGGQMIFYVCWILSAEWIAFSYVELFLQKAAFFIACWIFSAERRGFSSKCASFCWNVEYVESCSMQSSEKALLSAEMLNMLNMLSVLWPMRLPLQTMGFNGPKKHSTYSTYSTFQQKEAFFRNLTSNMIQHIQHSAERTKLKKKSLFRGKNPTWPQKVVLSAEKIQHGPKSGSFSRKIQHVPKMCFFLLKCWICWMHWPCDPKVVLNWKSPMGQRTFNIFNIFNISAERSIFSEP